MSLCKTRLNPVFDKWEEGVEEGGGEREFL